MPELAEIVQTHRNDDGSYRLSDLAIALGDIRETWQPVLEAADGTHRHWRTVFENDELDVYAISWLDGQTTGFHDHCTSSFGVTCVHGAVYEERPRNPMVEHEVRRLETGQVTGGVPGVMHLIRWAEGEPAITIHAYAPKLLLVGQIYIDREGRWVRRERDGREELTEGVLPC